MIADSVLLYSSVSPWSFFQLGFGNPSYLVAFEGVPLFLL